MRHILISFFVIAILAVPWLMINPYYANIVYSNIGLVENQVASAILSHAPKSVIEIKSKYFGNGINTTPIVSRPKVKILLVPGHEPDFGGAEYSNLFERQMTVELAEQLAQFIGSNSRYEVFSSRNQNGWSPIFSNYFKNNWDEIVSWTKNNREETERLSRIGEFHPVTPSVIHNKAPQDVAWRLYGISKWSNENDIDIIIHIHFNDNPGHSKKSPGKYSGFAIYVPQNQYFNSSTTHTVASSIFNRLQKLNPVSNFSGESGGIIETQDLIAVGAYNSVNAASMLIEYGYIYEPQFNDPELKDLVIKDLAFQTYLGLQDFFDDKSPANLSGAYDSLIMPYTWNSPILDSKYNSKDVYSLQTALVMDGEYPPNNKSMNDCPRTGSFGNCTKTAVESFQKKYGITGERGMVGTKTLEQLNKSYSVKTI
jgi:N-acetylmuramoyl-L-alanine amidase